MRITLFSGLVILSFGVVTSLAEETATRRFLSPDDIYRVQEISAPQVSPDGLWVAYVVSKAARETDEAVSAIWMVSWDGSEQRALTAASAKSTSPRWSPDGRYLSFLSAPTGLDKLQVMLLDRRDGETRPLTNTTGDIGEYMWSPDGKRLALVVEAERIPALTSVQLKQGAPRPIVINALHFKDDEEGYLGVGHERHIFLIDIESKKLEQITSDPHFNEDLPAWSPDGGRLAFTRTREKAADPDGKEDIDVMEARPDASPRTIARTYMPSEQKIAWSADGFLIAYLQGREPKFSAYAQDRLFVVPVLAGAPRALTDQLDRTVQSFDFTGKESIAIIVQDDGATYPAQVNIVSGVITRELAPGPFVVSALSSAGGHTALLLSDDSAVREVYAFDAGRLRKLTGHNDAFLAELQLGAVEDIRFRSKHGPEIHGLVVKPPSFSSGQKYPMILWIHGGPNSQDEHSLRLDGYAFEPQMLAAKGYVVLRINYRGGSGRGAAFAEAIFGDWGHKEVEDLLAGVDYLVSRGIADPKRLGIGGWSYGAILTDYTIATSNRFKAAASGAGSGNKISWYGTDQYISQYNSELGVPWGNTALWLKVSYPFFHADRIQTPALFLAGDKDFNVPVSGSEQMYEALRTLGVPTQLVIYPGEHHVITRPSFIKDIAERIIDWFDRYLQPPNKIGRVSGH